MALTGVGTSDAYCVKAWHEKFLRETMKKLFYMKYVDDNGDGPVLLLNDLMGKPGDVVHFDLVRALTGDGITGNQTLEGKEEEMLFYDDTITLNLRGNAVADDGPLSNQRFSFNITGEAAGALSNWLARKQDEDFVTAAETSYTKCFYIDGTTGAITAGVAATAKAAITVAATCLITPQLCRAAKTWASVGGRSSAGVESVQPIIEPMMVNGNPMYMVVCNEEVVYDMQTDTEWQQGSREAYERGPKNPIVSGAMRVMNGLAFHEYTGIRPFTNGGAGAIRGSVSQLLGKNAFAFGYAKKPTITDGWDKYHMKHGKAIHAIYGVTKSVFNSLDYGVVGITTSETNISGL